MNSLLIIGSAGSVGYDMIYQIASRAGISNGWTLLSLGSFTQL